jgi:hypothetical protein
VQYTVLQMTQNILSALNSDEVNSIGDSPESLQVATILQNTYYNMVGRTDLPEHEQLFQLTASTNPTLPTLMYVPQGVKRIDWVKYYSQDDDPYTDYDQYGAYQHDLNTDLVNNPSTFESDEMFYVEVRMLPITQFIDMINKFSILESDVESYTFNNMYLRYKNDKRPQFCTILQNYYILFDSYDNSVDDTLQTSKTQCFGLKVPEFLLQDNFTPDIDDPQFQLLINEAKSVAFFELKQQIHQKAEQESKRQWSGIQKDKSVSNKPTYFGQLPDFGRQLGSGGYALRSHIYRKY